jgi:asparagine synthase (glutamine-hydrolysing)
MEDVPGTWDHITELLLHVGQPFADTSLFAVNAICRLLRRHVTVALSGDGGDEGFGGYDLYWQIARISRWQRLPAPVWCGATMALTPLASIGIVPQRLPMRLKELTGADNTTIIQNLFCWIREEEHKNLCLDFDFLPVRRLFEPKWEYSPPGDVSRLDRLSAQATEVNTRLTLANDYLFKVDTASMKESLEVRVPMLDEDLFAFGLSLPHHLKVNGRTCKRVLRAIAERRLPSEIARKPKWGFGIPVDTWVDGDFRARLREVLLGSSSRLSEFFRPEAYRPILEAFCEGQTLPYISRQGLYQRAIMLLAVQLSVDGQC